MTDKSDALSKHVPVLTKLDMIEKEVSIDPQIKAALDPGSEINEKNTILLTKRFTKDEFSFKNPRPTLIQFRNFEVIFTDRGKVVIGARYYNHRKPPVNPVSVHMGTQNGTELDKFLFMNPISNRCRTWKRISWTGEYDADLYELIGTGWVELRRPEEQFRWC